MKVPPHCSRFAIAALGFAFSAMPVFAEEISVTTESSGPNGPTTVQEIYGIPTPAPTPTPVPVTPLPPVPMESNDALARKRNWYTLTASGLYIFDTADEVHGHTGWGGVIDFSAFLRSYAESPWYFKFGGDFIYYQTSADKTYSDGYSSHEELDSYKIHANAGAGWRWNNFDFSAFLGIGVGATHSNGTQYNLDGSHTSADFLFQVGARIAYQPVEWCSIFVGYRMMWSIPLEGGDECRYYDDDYYYYHCSYNRCDPGCRHNGSCNCSDKDKKDYPGVIAHAVEFGVTFYF